MVVTKNEFRDAMSRLGAAVNIVTTDGAEGRYGLTVSAVASITDEPPAVLVCLNRQSRGHSIVRANGVLCVNILGPCHDGLAQAFARSATTPAERFADRDAWVVMGSGSPALREASVSLDCRIDRVVDVGTHGMFICTVTEINLGAACEGLVYFDRRYHALV